MATRGQAEPVGALIGGLAHATTGQAASVEALVSGLARADVAQLAAAATTTTVADAGLVFTEMQIQELLQSLEDNAQATQHADRLARPLRQAGLLESNERVVGVVGETIYKVAQRY